MVTTLTAQPESREIKEEVSRGILRASMRNFRSFAEAVSELIDNAFDKFDGYRGGRSLEVIVQASKSKVIIQNVGGRGMGFEDLKKHWAKWGSSDTQEGIGEYGQGGKAAMGYIGNAWRVVSKRWDESVMWDLKEDDWRGGEDFKTYQVRHFPATKELEGLGYCRIEITSVDSRNQNLQHLHHQLGNVYLRLLDGGNATITLNGKAVSPIALPVYEKVPVTHFDEKTQGGLRVRGWVGELTGDARQRSPVTIHGGMRVLRWGRMICDGVYFGHPGPSYKQSLSRLIGEVEVPNAVPVLPNKTDFDRDSSQWSDVQTCLHKILKPHIDRLLQRPDEVTVTRTEKKRVQDIRKLMILALKQLDLQMAGGEGRKDPEPNSGPPKPPGKSRGLRGPYGPRAGMPEWHIQPIEPTKRWEWSTDKDTDGKDKAVLLVNKSFAWYRERKGDGLYIAETAALALAKTDQGLETYLDEANKILTAFGHIWATQEKVV